MAAELGEAMVERVHAASVLQAVVIIGKPDPHVRDVIPLDDTASALALVASGHALDVVVIEVN